MSAVVLLLHSQNDNESDFKAASADSQTPWTPEAKQQPESKGLLNQCTVQRRECVFFQLLHEFH